MKPLFYEYEPEVFVLINFWDIENGRYLVSNYGRLYDNVRQIYFNRPIDESRNNYINYCLYTNSGNTKNFRSNRLVAMAFIPKTDEDILLGRDQVNHKDGVKYNDYYRNLEWVNNSENQQHAYMLGLNPGVGENAKDAKRTNEMTHKVCQCIVQGMNNKECCLAVGLEPNSSNIDYIRSIRRGRYWKSISRLYNIDYNEGIVKISEEQIHEVCRLLESGIKGREISKKTGIPEYTISSIKNKKSYIHISDNYKF